MKDLKEFGVQEMNTKEIKEIDGGIFGAILAGVVIAGATVVFTDWDNFKKGLMGEPEIKK
ncbi:hypothetical protein [Marinifilum fragile]|uniref:hypothetical protein n=1 Tax=Marinifilum fragile TaxID=570161 RepID=UPI002AAB5032|nr:hypothetical protein [Marinifilum fragile]